MINNQAKKMIAVVPLWDDAKESIWMLPGYMDGIRDSGAMDKIMEHAKYIKDNDLPHEGLDIIQTKWYGRILLELCKHETMRFGELKRALPGISNVVLSATLKGLTYYNTGKQ